MIPVRWHALIVQLRLGKVDPMKRRNSARRTALVAGRVFVSLLLVSAWASAWCEASTAAASAFNAYVGKVDSRFAEQHREANGFLASVGTSVQRDARLRGGELIIEQLTPAAEADPPGALLHHWRGTAFVRGAKAGDFERLMKDFDGYPQRFSPQVMQAKILTPHDEEFLTTSKRRCACGNTM